MRPDIEDVNEAKMKARFWRAMRQALYEEVMTVPQRENAPKLSRVQVREICSRWVQGEKQEALAAEYGVCASAISYHVRGLRREMRAAA